MDISLLIPKNENLVTYFVLPMIGINKTFFGKKYKTAYISKTNLVYIHLKEKLISSEYKAHSNFLSELFIDNNLYNIFIVPEDKLKDLRLFKKGLYSTMSRETKKDIYKISTLKYNSSMSDFKVSDPILHALDSTKVLRKFLKDYLNVEVLSDTGELINPPDDDWYIEYQLKLK